MDKSETVLHYLFGQFIVANLLTVREFVLNQGGGQRDRGSESPISHWEMG